MKKQLFVKNVKTNRGKMTHLFDKEEVNTIEKILGYYDIRPGVSFTNMGDMTRLHERVMSYFNAQTKIKELGLDTCPECGLKPHKVLGLCNCEFCGMEGMGWWPG